MNRPANIPGIQHDHSQESASCFLAVVCRPRLPIHDVPRPSNFERHEDPVLVGALPEGNHRTRTVYRPALRLLRGATLAVRRNPGGQTETHELTVITNETNNKGAPTMKKLEGKIAVVTGGNSGIGLATAKLLREEGAKVAISGRDQSTLDAAAKEIGEGTLAIRADIPQA